MITGKLNEPETYGFLMNHAVWKEAFDWLKVLPENPEPGIHAIRNNNEMFANVHGYAPIPREQCRYESHRKYVDLQYVIRGGELIEWQLAGKLNTDGGYDAEKDLQFYRLGESKTVIHKLPGHFSIYYPPDAHLPKMHDGIHDDIFKLVIKIQRSLLD